LGPDHPELLSCIIIINILDQIKPEIARTLSLFKVILLNDFGFSIPFPEHLVPFKVFFVFLFDLNQLLKPRYVLSCCKLVSVGILQLVERVSVKLFLVICYLLLIHWS